MTFGQTYTLVRVPIPVDPVDPRNSQYPRESKITLTPIVVLIRTILVTVPTFRAQSGTQRRSQSVDIASDKNPPIFVSGPVESIVRLVLSDIIGHLIHPKFSMTPC